MAKSKAGFLSLAARTERKAKLNGNDDQPVKR